MSDYDDELFIEDEIEEYSIGEKDMTKKTIANDEPHYILGGRGYLISTKRFATQAEALEEAPKHIRNGYGSSEIVVYEAKAVVKADPVPVKITTLLTKSN